MPTYKNKEDFMEPFRQITLLGEEVIPSYLVFYWKEYIEQYKNMLLKEIQDFLPKCQTIAKYLLEFKYGRKGKEIATEFYQEFNYKNAYAKDIANVIATFAPYPQNIQFLQGYYESFLEITKEEENDLTEKINKIKTINDFMKSEISYENAQFLSDTAIINVDINGQITPVIRWSNDMHCGVNENNELVIYEQIGEEFDVVYIVKEDNTYTRLINRHQKLTPNGMLASKTLITDEQNKVLSIDNYDILVNPNFYDQNQKGFYYKKVCHRLATTDSLTSLNITQEALKLTSLMDEDNHTICAAIFDKILKEGITKNSETK